MKKTILIISLFLIVFSGQLFGEIQPTHRAILMATLWHQTSAEYRALAYQAYNIAKLRLEEELKISYEKKRAVVVDIDETVLDNSLYEGKIIKYGIGSTHDFDNWVDLAIGEPVPGALEFLQYAHENGVEIFYISNRSLRHMRGSLKNLQKLGFPQADEEHILLRDKSSDKGIRRNMVSENYEIVLLIGDNLIDFDDIFRKKNIEERFNWTDSLKAEFGKRCRILPNSMYGEWEKSLYGGTRRIPEEEKEKKRLEHLKSY